MGFLKMFMFSMLVINSINNGYCQSSAKESFTLKSDFWKIRISPATLLIEAIIDKSSPLVISSPQEGFLNINNLTADSNSLDWQTVDTSTEFSIQLHQRELNVTIKSNEIEKIDFPVIPGDKRIKAYIIPYREGKYAPLDDPNWRNYLSYRSFNTMEGLTMPFFGVELNSNIITTIITNRFNNNWRFKKYGQSITSIFTHEFKKISKSKEISFIFHLSENSSPVEPAKVFRKYLEDNNKHVRMAEKIQKNPKVDRLKGAIHAYLWGDLKMSIDDVLPGKWKVLCSQLVQQSEKAEPSPGLHIKALAKKEHWKEIVKCYEYPYRPFPYLKAQVAEAISLVLFKPSFRKELNAKSDNITESDLKKLTESERFRLNSLLFYKYFPNLLKHPEQWGYGYSLGMLRQIHEAGIKKARLVHDLWDFGMVDTNPRVAKEADRLGFLIGSYDSFHSIHDPDHYGTDHSWSTAQFDRTLFEKGGIRLESGKMKKGFGGRGYLLSPLAARPWVEKRVNRIIKTSPYNSYFIDCDAYGEVFDNYAPEFLSSQQEDMEARIDRMKWIGEEHDLVIGSEGGSSFAAPVIHVAEGMTTMPFGKWIDHDFGDQKSKYFLGKWFPRWEPQIFFKRVPLKERFYRLRYDPRFRLPLNEVVFHDSFVSTPHWQSSTRKFKDIQDIVELSSLLYLTPPLYHFNPPVFKKIKKEVVQHYNFFNPLHEKWGFSQMTDFQWLSEDRKVQKTEFGEGLVMVANFREKNFLYESIFIPPRSILAHRTSSGEKIIYSPGR